MGRKKRAVNPTYYIVCEGEKTEPNFLFGFRKYLVKHAYIDNKEQITIYPVPEEEKESPSPERGAYKGKRRSTKKVATIVEAEDRLKGQPPLCWVEKAASKAKEYDFLWAVFDKDQHPKAAEAFALAENSAPQVHIAFSSLCFEYYLLLHFEYLYSAFEKSECRIGPKTIKCGLNKETVKENDCHGEKCVNGYARWKNYWKETKKNESTFHPVEDKLWKGVYIAHVLRKASDFKCGEHRPIWLRNPYVTTDALITQLMGYQELGIEYCCELKQLRLSYSRHQLILENISSALAILPSTSFGEVYTVEGGAPFQCERINLLPGKPIFFDLTNERNKIITFKYEGEKVYFVVNE